MKLISLIVFLTYSAAYAAGPAGPKIPSKAAPFFHREVIIDLRKGLSKAVCGCSRVILIFPSLYTPQADELDFKKVLDLLPKTMISLTIKEGILPLPLPLSFFKGLGKFQLLKHLSLPISSRDQGKVIDLTRLCLKSLRVVDSRRIVLRLPLALENLTLKEENFPATNKMVKRLKKAHSRNFKSLKYESYGAGHLSHENLMDILDSLVRGLDRRAPERRKIDFLKLYLDHIEFTFFEKLFENSRSFKRLSLKGHHPPFSPLLPGQPSEVVNAEKEKVNAKALFVLLRNLESLSLTDYEGLPRLFQGAEKLEGLAIQRLSFKERYADGVLSTPEDVKGIISAFQIKSLKILNLDSVDTPDNFVALLPQILAEKNLEEIKNLKELHFHTFNLNLAVGRYDNGLRHFLEVVFDKAPLTAFSFAARNEASYKGHEQWIFETFLQRYKGDSPLKAFSTLKTLELRGPFHTKALQNLFGNKDNQGILGNPALKTLRLRGSPCWKPQSLSAFLGQFVSKDTQKEAASLPEKEAVEVFRKALHIRKELEISFIP